MLGDSCQPLRDDLERTAYHLEVLREVAAQIEGTRKPRAILETVLLSAMGGLGASGGCACKAPDFMDTVFLSRGDSNGPYGSTKRIPQLS